MDRTILETIPSLLPSPLHSRYGQSVFDGQVSNLLYNSYPRSSFLRPREVRNFLFFYIKVQKRPLSTNIVFAVQWCSLYNVQRPHRCDSSRSGLVSPRKVQPFLSSAVQWSQTCRRICMLVLLLEEEREVKAKDNRSVAREASLQGEGLVRNRKAGGR